jgi:hypothetical protein
LNSKDKVADLFKRPGRLKNIYNRTRGDLGIFTFPMITYLAVKDGLSLWWLLAIPVYLVYKWFDVRKHHMQENDYNFEKCSYAMKQYKMVEEMYKYFIINHKVEK